MFANTSPNAAAKNKNDWLPVNVKQVYATHICRQTTSSAELLQLNQGSLSLGYKKFRDIPGPNSFFRTLQGLAFSALTLLVG